MMRGIHAIAYALFDADERLDRAAMKRQTEICLATGVDGIAALGLATEVSKLSEAERRTVMDWTAADVGKRVPVTFTIYGNSVAEQVAQAKHAERIGASGIILQPPAVGSYAGIEYIRFFGRIADATSLPVAIQNAPAYMGRGLTAAEIKDLVTQHPNVQALKGEGSVVDIKAVIDATAGRLPVLNGRGGLELTDNFRAGCAGMILAPDTIDKQVAIWRALQAGHDADAERLYEQVLPSIVFIMQSIESLICYGKRVFAARAGLPVHDRAPAMRPTPLGLDLVANHAARLGPYPAI
jgi:dihydrodipicolinate synthase/N-acetylneuraminate lyase